MPWEVEYTTDFELWWDSLTEGEQESVTFGVELLEERGPALARPCADTVRQSKHGNMRELRCQHQGRPYRVLFAFDPQRTALLLIGGDKTGNPRWYEQHVPLADRLFSEHLCQLRKE